MELIHFAGPQHDCLDALSPEVNAKFKDLMKGVAKTWSEGLDGRGKRGSDALREFDAAVAAIPAK